MANLPSKVYQLNVSLQGIKPSIWRCLLVEESTTLTRLHKIIQIAMGWKNDHLYSFKHEKKRYERTINPHGGEDSTKRTSATLAKLDLQEKDSLLYTYDFGDNWEHLIRIEAIHSPNSSLTYPMCLAGKRACPPEDCGGIWEYERLLKILQDRNHPEYQERIGWLEEEFNPEAFEEDVVNKILHRTFHKKK